ncbi:TPA: restriction endonuclease subunit S [Serratia marcescens]|nr:restriction endonuclease subunit S [Serratia marcescens]
MSFNSTPKELIEQNINGLLSIHDSWQRIPMDAIAKITNGFAFKSSEFNTKKDGLPLIRIRDVLKGNTSTYYSGPVPEGYWVNPEDLIVGMDGDFNTTIWYSEPALLNQRVCKIDIDEEKYSKRFFFHTLPGYLSAINVNTSSVTVKHLSSRTLQETLFPLPPLAEQKIIAEKLDTLLAQVDSTKARLEQIPQILKFFRQAVLISAVNGRLTKEYHPNGIFGVQTSLGELISNGPQNGLYKSSKFYGEGVKIIRIDSFYDGKILSLDKLKKVDISTDEKNRWQLHENDILINRVNSIEYLGKCAHVKMLSEDVVFESNIMRFSIDTTMISPEYLTLFLCSAAGIKELRKNAKLAVNQASINQTDVKNCKLTLPTLTEQAEIVRRVEQLFAYADTIEKQVNSALTRVNRLTQSILSKAFRGELTAQWRAENPDLISGENSAAALLEKIKAERAASGGKKTARKKA